MTWKDSGEEIKIDAPNEAAYREEDYSPLGPKKRSLGRLFQMPNWPFGWIAAGLLAVIVLLLFMFGGSDSSHPSGEFRKIAERMADFENRLAKLETQALQGEQTGGNPQQAKQYLERLDRFEETTTKRMEYLTKRLDKLSEKTSSDAPVTPKAEEQAAPPAQPAAQYHLVSKGETLYSIGRAYGVTVTELRRLNKLDATTAIYPGQKLKIK
jgi:LysM repeat protein